MTEYTCPFKGDKCPQVDKIIDKTTISFGKTTSGIVYRDAARTSSTDSYTGEGIACPAKLIQNSFEKALGTQMARNLLDVDIGDISFREECEHQIIDKNYEISKWEKIADQAERIRLFGKLSLEDYLERDIESK